MKFHHVILLSSLAVGACTDVQKPTIGRPLAVTPASVSAASVKNVRTLAEQLWRAQKWLEDASGVNGLGDLFLPSDSQAGGTATSSRGAARQRLILPDAQADFDEVMDNFSKFLNERVLVASQIESKSDTAVTYKLAPTTFCNPEWARFEACKQVLSGIDVRVKASSLAEGDIDLTVLLGDEQQRAAQFALHADLLSAVVELEPAADLLNRISTAFTDEGDAALLLTRASGTAGLSMRRLTADDLELQATVTAPIALTMTDGTKAESLDVENGRASLDLNVAGDKAVVDVDFGKAEVRGDKSLVVPSQSVDVACAGSADGTSACDPVESDPEPEVTGTFTLTAGPLAVWAALTNDGRHVDVKGLVAGPVALTLDDTKVAEYTIGDLRPLDLLVEAVEVAPAAPATDRPGRS